MSGPSKALAPTHGSQQTDAMTSSGQPCTLADVKKRPGKVVLTTTNAAFIDFTDNWLESVRRTRACPNITIVAEDDQTMAYYSNKTGQYPGLRVIKTRFGTVSPEILQFNSEPYKKFVNKRQKYVLPLIQNGYEVLFTDVDTYWLKDPFPYFTDDFDLAVERDLPKFYCAGFVYFKPSKNTIAFLREWIDFMTTDKSLKPDQKVMNDLMKKKKIPGLNVKILDSANFPNGKLFFNEKWRGDKKEIVVVHNNWIVGHDTKVERFKSCGMWSVGKEAVVDPKLCVNL